MACSKIDGTGVANARGGSHWDGQRLKRTSVGRRAGGKEAPWANRVGAVTGNFFPFRGPMSHNHSVGGRPEWVSAVAGMVGKVRSRLERPGPRLSPQPGWGSGDRVATGDGPGDASPLRPDGVRDLRSGDDP